MKMHIEVISPSPLGLVDGNRVTAERWAKILRELGNEVDVRSEYGKQRVDLLIALHARNSVDSVTAFRDRFPDSPLIVALTGSDLYRDLPKDASVLRVLEMATRLVVLHRRTVHELPESVRGKTWVIYQAADQPDVRVSPQESQFQIAVVANLTPDKDPFRAALAARELPLSSLIQIQHAGGAPDAAMERKAKNEEKRNPRYHWLGALPHEKALRLIDGSRLVVIASQYEGGSNVLSEALACSVPALVSRTSGLVGTLGDEYPGYFPVGDTSDLARLMRKAETDESFYEELRRGCARASWLVRPEQERASLRELLNELSVRPPAQRALFSRLTTND